MAASRKTINATAKAMPAPQCQTLDPTYGFGITDLTGDERQIEKDKASMTTPIEDAFDDNCRQ